MKAINRGKIYSQARIELGKVVPLSTPFSLEVDVCGLCNLQCKFCFHNDAKLLKKYGFSENMMDYSLFKKIINESKGFDNKIKKLKLSSFGEPLLHPDLAKMISFAKENEVADYIELTTNGLEFSAPKSQAIIDAGVDRINISINGLTTGDYVRNCRRSVDVLKVRENLEYLYSIKNNCWIYIKLGDMGYSEEERQRFYEMYGDICDEIYIENILDDAYKDADAKGKQDSAGVGAYSQKMVEKKICTFLFSRMMVKSDGQVSACCMDWQTKEKIGDLKKDNIVDVWRGDCLRRLQMLHLTGRKDEIEICRGCKGLSAFTTDNIDLYAEEILERMK